MYICSIVRRLLKHDKGLANVQKSDGFTALHLAILNKHHEIARLLIEQVNF